MNKRKLSDFLKSKDFNSDEDYANQLLSSIQDEFIEKYGSNDSFKYLAIVKNSFDMFCLELAYHKTEDDNYTNIEDILSFIRTNIKNRLSVILTPKFMKYEELEKSINLLPINAIKSEKRFKYHTGNSMSKSKKEEVCDLNVGTFINVANEESGSLGAIVKLKKDNSFYLITNYHVIIKSKEPLNSCVYENNRCIGLTYWGKFNSSYDIAIARLHCKNLNKESIKYSFEEPIKPRNGAIVNKNGLKGPGTGYIYSSNAIIKIKNKVYKNQILIKDLNLVSGESGTIVSTEINKKRHVVGLHFGGDSELDISNNLYNIFYSEIKEYIDNEKRKHPSIHFNSFI